MNDDRKTILDQIAEGKLSADDGLRLLQDFERKQKLDFNSKGDVSQQTFDEILAQITMVVKPEFLFAMRELYEEEGMSHFELKELILKNIDPGYVKALAKLGYKKLSKDDLYGFLIYNISPEYLTELRMRGYQNIPPSQLIKMGLHNVDMEYLDDLADQGYAGLSPNQLVKMSIR
ncbi:MAG: hypothetical protein ACTSSH_06995, partial [Candidatus Heimdallarchaeota archaeon]